MTRRLRAAAQLPLPRGRENSDASVGALPTRAAARNRCVYCAHPCHGKACRNHTGILANDPHYQQ